MHDDGEQNDDFCWATLAARLLHPVQVEIIESLRWIGRPLSATDFVYVFGGKRAGLRIEYHLRRLRKLGVVAPANVERGGLSAAERPYRLVNRPRSGPADA
jgi:predicted MarR family transcription regulator